MKSCLYMGKVRHRRRGAVEHAFRFPLFMAYLDLDELDSVFAGRWLWSTRGRAFARFDGRDHLGGGETPLKQRVRDVVEAHGGRRPTGPVRLLTNLRYAGLAFNPVSFFYCFDDADEELVAVVAEVTNTPWAERHCYLLDGRPRGARGVQQHAPKRFHVSPFMPMELDYRFRLERPGRHLVARIESRTLDGVSLFDACLALERREVSGRSLAWALARFPFMTLQTLSAIYWQALRLWLRGAPFHPHPNPVKRSSKHSEMTA